MRNEKLIIKKAKILKTSLIEYETFNIYDAIEVLREAKATVYWTLSNLTKLGYLTRVGQGLYTFIKKESPPKPIISLSAKKIWNLLVETEYDFFISGLDILSIFMQHVPEKYPVVLFINKYSKDDIINILLQQNYNIKIGKKQRTIINEISSKNNILYLHLTSEFNYADNGFAFYEKAFVDLYYETTRVNYPLSLQELERIYMNMKRRLYLNIKKMVKIAARRNIQSEIKYIINNNSISGNFIK